MSFFIYSVRARRKKKTSRKSGLLQDEREAHAADCILQNASVIVVAAASNRGWRPWRGASAEDAHAPCHGDGPPGSLCGAPAADSSHRGTAAFPAGKLFPGHMLTFRCANRNTAKERSLQTAPPPQEKWTLTVVSIGASLIWRHPCLPKGQMNLNQLGKHKHAERRCRNSCTTDQSLD